MTGSRKVHLVLRGMNSNFLLVRKWHFTYFSLFFFFFIPTILVLSLNVCVIGIDFLSLLNTPKGLAGIQCMTFLTNSYCLSLSRALRRMGGESEKLEARGYCRGHINVACQNAYFLSWEIWMKSSSSGIKYPVKKQIMLIKQARTNVSH